ncbi:LysM peptidoglycan-binding domain-containing protein [Streptomyces sp. Tu102]|uniref:CIS tube protein n=1 Tax=Streptomyces sp. Tu102 TaxID=2838019 RepID=UPI001BDBE87D|nr:LysM peptidoglycan-binding domain-containing protein [Streptomyces sp. Tu102]MBT1090316.1 LysM peptidoglycan-binding domain-containing protein [Streptomyces sp. Tu102]
MPMKQLTITPLDGRGNAVSARTVTVDYNPEEFSVAKDNNFAVQGVPGLPSPVVQFVSGNQRTLEVELFFDTYDTKELPKRDVRLLTEQVTGLMELDAELHAPPVLVVAMAGFRFTCVLSRAQQRFLLLMPDGTPVRARVNCTFIEYKEPARAAVEANLQTADYTKVHTVLPGETLSSIAADRYDDPALWRPLALANGLADPRDLRPGQSLLVPALPYTDPRTLEVTA